MNDRKVMLVTGASGLIGGEVCLHFAERGWQIHGLDNNQRRVFFGPEGDTLFNRHRIASKVAQYMHHDLDIRDRQGIAQVMTRVRPDAIVHSAAQPSHDLAARITFDDFETNAVGTLNLLEAARCTVPTAPFVYLSSNKVYGDRPNLYPLVEQETRWEFAELPYGVSEECSVDQSKHSLMGASKLAADILVQEFGRYYGMFTCCLRGGCLTGPFHSGVELHGFLSYLVKCNLEGRTYRVFGYKGKQVRDNIHSADVARFIECFIESPRVAEVYNLGGGKGNSCSILEAFSLVEQVTGKKMLHEYVDINRIGDHICYYSDLRKCREHFPDWNISKTLQDILMDIVEGWRERA